MNRKIACITGSSRGIGKAIAECFAAGGYDIVLNCHKDTLAMEQVKHKLESTYSVHCFPLVMDVSDSNAVSEGFALVASEFGEIDVLVNNAGISYFGLLSDMTASQWQQVLSTNLSSAFYCSKAAIPSMVRRKSGRILNISSIWGNSGASYEVAYSAAKGGLNTLTKALAKELAPSNIPVNAISCGVIDTDMNKHLSQEELDSLIEEIPACRLGTPEEVGQLAFLLSQAPTYLTGQIVTLDGGFL